METYEETTTSAGSNGYTCTKCGMWVWNNAYHVCIGPPMPQYYWPQYYVSDRSQEIIDLLKEILAALDKGEEK